MRDVIVVGARCAGAATAMLLARQGHRILLLDRAQFPADIPQGHFVHRQGPLYLELWGLLAAIEASGCPLVDHVIADFGDFPLECEDLRANGIPFGCGPRRKVLDKLLIEAAIEAEADFRPHCVVERYLFDERGTMTGVRVRDTATGSVFTETARLIVGADGRNSTLARTVQAPVYDAAPTLACYYFTYWGGVRNRGLEVYIRGSRVVFGHPTNDGLFAVFVGWPAAEFPRIKLDIERHYMDVLDLIPDLSARIRVGRRAERYYGSADLPNFFRKPYGPGWALVGDAGHHKDPHMALGCRDAFAHADLLAEAVHKGLGGTCTLDNALQEYEQNRNRSATELYRRNLARAAFAPMPPEFLQLRQAVRTRKPDAARFWLADQGMIPREDFFNAANMERLLGTRAAAGS